MTADTTLSYLFVPRRVGESAGMLSIAALHTYISPFGRNFTVYSQSSITSHIIPELPTYAMRPTEFTLPFRTLQQLYCAGVGELETPFLPSENLQMFERMETISPLIIGSPASFILIISVQELTYATGSAQIRLKGPGIVHLRDCLFARNRDSQGCQNFKPQQFDSLDSFRKFIKTYHHTFLSIPGLNLK
ncbi:hypothetical protein E2P81_ATG00887 [Venturia nashicola]|nr:hypothetical protein E2P81_ATG00887 [Venturia nashicola]